jgi:hypothetical protein
MARDLDKPTRNMPAIATEIRQEVDQIEHARSIRARAQLTAPRAEEPEPQDDLQEPKREDYSEGNVEEDRFLLDKAEYHQDRLLARYREVVAIAAEIIADEPVSGAAFVASAATGIEFLTANRAVEHSSDGEYDDNFAAAREAWLVHRKALDTWYATEGKPPMDQRPLSVWDASYDVPPLEEDESLSTPNPDYPIPRDPPDYPPTRQPDPVVRKKKRLVASWGSFLVGLAVAFGAVAVTSDHELAAVMSMAATILLASSAGLAFAYLLRQVNPNPSTSRS